MKKLLFLLVILSSAGSFAQGSIILSQENANDKGITPIWPGCDGGRQTPIVCFKNKLRNHIMRTYRYPEEAVADRLTGTVTVEFIVNVKGKVEIIEVKGAHRYLQREAIRIIRSLPKMKPGKWGKKPISVAYEVPITFLEQH